MRILLLGATGQVGSVLKQVLAADGNLVAPIRNELDLASLSAVKIFLQNYQPDIIINAAAYTNVARAEIEKPLAMKINSYLPEELATYAKRTGAFLIHYSTDYVFDGFSKVPYKETDSTNPLNAYGESKLLGEQLIATSGCDFIIFRTSWVHSSLRQNFIAKILSLAKIKNTIEVVSDQYGTPTSANLLAHTTSMVLKHILNKQDQPKISGIYHLTSAGETNWYEYACLVVQEAKKIYDELYSQQLGFRRGTKRTVEGVYTQYMTEGERACNKVENSSAKSICCNHIIPIQSAMQDRTVIRPAYSVLDTSKIRNMLQIQLPHWSKEVIMNVGKLLNNYSHLASS